MFPVNNPVASVALAANSSNVDTVIVAGEIVKAGGQLINVSVEKVRHFAEESRDYLVSRAEGASIGGGWQPPATW
jgi:cytosine/adenosine deaminase-related metal-dependent hydrolase